MHNSFLSIVGLIEHGHQVRLLPEYLEAIHGAVAERFSDFEIILVNNAQPRTEIEEAVRRVAPAVQHHVYLLNLSGNTYRNNAVVAGLDRANGDYTIFLEFQFAPQAEQLIVDLYDRSREGFDIVYLQAKQRGNRRRWRPFVGLFYWILRKYSDLRIDPLAHDTRIISRRALNSLLRLRENLRYMKAIYSMVGYQTTHLMVEQPLHEQNDLKFSEQFRTGLVAITSFTSFLRSLMLWIFLTSLAFLAVVIYNAIKVKVDNYDILGNYYKTVPGWTFLVVLISIFFAITCLNIYIVSIYLSNIYQEIKQRPLYIVESVQRF